MVQGRKQARNAAIAAVNCREEGKNEPFHSSITPTCAKRNQPYVSVIKRRGAKFATKCYQRLQLCARRHISLFPCIFSIRRWQWFEVKNQRKAAWLVKAVQSNKITHPQLIGEACWERFVTRFYDSTLNENERHKQAAAHTHAQHLYCFSSCTVVGCKRC